MKLEIMKVANGFVVRPVDHDQTYVTQNSALYVFETFGAMVEHLRDKFAKADVVTKP